MKKGYTMAEALVTLVVIGTLTALTIPLINTVISHNDVLYKTAFQLTEKVAADLTKDLTLYPTGDLSTPSANTFCTNFAARVSTIGTVDCSSDKAWSLGVPNFTTTNGMKWYFYPAANPNFNSSAGYAVSIWVDINGNQAPNTLGTDILVITAYKSGKVTALTSPEIGYLSQ